MTMRNPKIVVIEDDPATRRLFETVLGPQDYDLVMAAAGHDGLEKVRLHLPDLVITDILLPEKDGYVVLEAMKRDPALAEVPVILISAIYVSEVDRRRGLELGADRFLLKPDAFLSKPFRANALLDAVQITLGEKRAPENEREEPRATIAVLSRVDKDRRLLARRLEAEGYAAVEVEKIEDVAQAIHLEQPAALIADIDFMDDPAAWLRALNEEWPDLALLAVASEQAELDFIAVMRSGVDDLRRKPLDFDVFFHSIEEAIEVHTLRSSQNELTEQLKRTTADLLDRIARLEKSNRVLEDRNRELSAAQNALRSREEIDADAVAESVRSTLRVATEASGQAGLLADRSEGAEQRLALIVRSNVARIAQLLSEVGQLIGRSVEPFSGSGPAEGEGE